MKKFFGLFMAVTALVSLTTVAASFDVSEYLDSALSILPNQLSLSVFEEIGHTNNAYKSSGDRRSAFYFKTGVAPSILRENGNLTYGLKGRFSYDYYTRFGGDLNQFNWSLTPTISYKDDGEGLVRDVTLGVKSVARVDALNNADRRYARSYTTTVGAGADLAFTEKLGALVNGKYVYDYYSQEEFNGFTKKVYSADLTPYFQVTEKTRAGVRFGYEATKYVHSDVYDDYNRYVVNGLVDFHDDKFGATMEAGVEHMNFDGVTGHVADSDGKWTFNGSLKLKYKPVDNFETSLALSTSHDNSSVNERTDSIRNKIALGAKWQATSHIVLLARGGISDNDEKFDKDDSREFFGALEADYVFNSGISVYLGYKYRNIQFRYDSDLDYSVTEYFMGCRYTF
ncbi:MAG: hypothetical protein J5654_07555 [Victivallales bacterium]|nr:hypothetical protein [Victivallales bacterium]